MEIFLSIFTLTLIDGQVSLARLFFITMNSVVSLKQKHEVSSNRALKFRSDMLTNYLTRLSQPSQLLHNRHKQAYEAFYLNSQANGLS